MTLGAEFHWWKPFALERDLFDYLVCMGLLTIWFDKRLVSQVMRDDHKKREAVRKEIISAEKVRGK